MRSKDRNDRYIQRKKEQENIIALLHWQNTEHVN